eukprot:GFKZ01009455.1.p1 GENE.GFKZ01009455.1~~GFKZ01009455.1.p1  ORF type:complete len:244 (-),score=40.67 GFKZ01009455.1:472-1203(-)
MRGLNLSRLAARGRASESTFFKSQQSDQAKKLRAALKPEEISALSSAHASSGKTPSVDILSEISAHSTYRNIIQNPSPLPTKAKPNFVLQRLADPNVTHSADVGITARIPPDTEILRALGSSRLGMLQDLTPEGRPLPGAERYAQGAVLGIGAFGVATGIVASIGLLGFAYAYTHPSIIDVMRKKTLGFGNWMDQGVGTKLRLFAQKVRQNGPVLSEETLATAGKIAEGVGGTKRDGNNDEKK